MKNSFLFTTVPSVTAIQWLPIIGWPACRPDWAAMALSKAENKVVHRCASLTTNPLALPAASGNQPTYGGLQPTKNQAKKPIFQVEPTRTKREILRTPQGLKARYIIARPAGPGTTKAISSRSVRPAQIALKNETANSNLEFATDMHPLPPPLALPAASGYQPTCGGLPTSQKPCKNAQFPSGTDPNRARIISIRKDEFHESPYYMCHADPFHYPFQSPSISHP
jgi:hypothetical protein